MSKISIIQPNYIPWKGYFDLIAKSNKFVVLDDVQYTNRDWRNRNKIKTPSGLSWLTIPVLYKGNSEKKINEIQCQNINWQENHLEQFKRNYKKSEYFNETFLFLESLYSDIKTNSLLEINLLFLKAISRYLGIETEFVLSSELDINSKEKSNRILEICKIFKATNYITGESSKNYLNDLEFKNESIEVHYEDYSNYPTYKQNWGEFIHQVSIVDLLFNCGPNSSKYLKFLNNVN